MSYAMIKSKLTCNLVPSGEFPQGYPYRLPQVNKFYGKKNYYENAPLFFHDELLLYNVGCHGSGYKIVREILVLSKSEKIQGINEENRRISPVYMYLGEKKTTRPNY